MAGVDGIAGVENVGMMAGTVMGEQISLCRW